MMMKKPQFVVHHCVTLSSVSVGFLEHTCPAVLRAVSCPMFYEQEFFKGRLAESARMNIAKHQWRRAIEALEARAPPRQYCDCG